MIGHRMRRNPPAGGTDFMTVALLAIGAVLAFSMIRSQTATPTPVGGGDGDWWGFIPPSSEPPRQDFRVQVVPEEPVTGSRISGILATILPSSIPPAPPPPQPEPGTFTDPRYMGPPILS